MANENNLAVYKQYLHTVQAYLDKYFDNQKEETMAFRCDMDALEVLEKV